MHERFIVFIKIILSLRVYHVKNTYRKYRLKSTYQLYGFMLESSCIRNAIMR